MTVLLLKLAAPLQSWGASSRFTERTTRHEPSKSGVIGLLAAALGRRREDPVDDLAALRFAVRVDQPGSFMRDFQTEHTRKWDSDTRRFVFNESLSLSKRDYLSDAVFVAALEGDEDLLAECAEALHHPAFPLFLGRRSCPPSTQVYLGLVDSPMMETLADVPWQATERHWNYAYRFRGDKPKETVELKVVYEATEEQAACTLSETVRDVPLSFSQLKREYGWRTEATMRMAVKNPFWPFDDGRPTSTSIASKHDPFAILEEGSE